MTESEAAAPGSGLLETLQNQSGHSRRPRPPDVENVVGDENRVPLKEGKLHRRESRMGLRNIFGRSSRNVKDFDGHVGHRDLSRPGGIRASLAEISNWPYYGLHGARSEVTLSTIPSRPTSTALDAHPDVASPTPTPYGQQPANKWSGRPVQRPTAPPRTARGSLATWDPPPLFQAYPQAIRHSQLPACTASADSILRMSERKGSTSLREDLTQASVTVAEGEEAEKDKGRKRHRRNTSGSNGHFQWTQKIFVLVTSGYLLQYSCEGSFDRLPEKMLHLGKDSAAFVSDVIPGRHWVLQVASAMEADGSAPADSSRGLFSRLPFRAADKRHASNFLMVFEGADEMETWIAILRREIEALGGKKSLSETGKPRTDDHVVELRAQPSQRTLVVKDPERFSRVIVQDLPWQQNASDDNEGSVTVVESESTPEQSLDDISTTNSVVSHDGRQLDSLRESGNRLSFISSGQRTIVTSAGSSPACSPTREGFARELQDDPQPPESVVAYEEVRVRPNAAEILDRRQSMRPMNHFADPRLGSIARPQSTTFADHAGSHLIQSQTIPNFSVPHSIGRRYSLARTPPLESAPFAGQNAPAHEADFIPRSSRRPPPSALPISRPLSVVADLPSPNQDEPMAPERPCTRQSEQASSRPTTANGSPTGSVDSLSRVPNTYAVPDRRSSLAPRDLSPRKYSSMLSLRVASESATFSKVGTPVLPRSQTADMTSMPPPPMPPMASPPQHYPVQAEDFRRCRSSMDQYDRNRSISPSTRRSSEARSSSHARAGKRASLQVIGLGVMTPRDVSPGPARRSRDSLHGGPLLVSLPVKPLMNRRSMPQLAPDMPPPAPPPTCALPPIPQKYGVKA